MFTFLGMIVLCKFIRIIIHRFVSHWEIYEICYHRKDVSSRFTYIIIVSLIISLESKSDKYFSSFIFFSIVPICLHHEKHKFVSPSHTVTSGYIPLTHFMTLYVFRHDSFFHCKSTSTLYDVILYFIFSLGCCHV